MDVIQTKLLLLVGILLVFRLGIMFSGDRSDYFRRRLCDWCDTGIVASLITLVLMTFIFQLTVVEGDSMLPSLHDAEFTVVNKLIYRLHKPQRGDIVVFKAWREDRDYIKRVIALPGETVEIKKGWVVVKGLRLNEPYKLHQLEPPRYFPKITVPPGHLFVMGDNRFNSTDSRMEGPLPVKNILGKASFILWPPNRWGFIRSFEGKRFRA